MSLAIRIVVFAFVTWATYASGVSLGAFLLGAFWALVSFGYPHCIRYNR